MARKEAENGIVLLKNAGDLLPLSPDTRRILAIGAHADTGVISGGGSSSVTPPGSLRLPGTNLMGFGTEKVYHPSSPLSAIRSEVPGVVSYADGTDVAAAARSARDADVVIVFAEEWRTEALDATGLALPGNQNALIEAVATVNPRTIVVLETGGPVTMPWLDKVPAVLDSLVLRLGGRRGNRFDLVRSGQSSRPAASHLPDGRRATATSDAKRSGH